MVENDAVTYQLNKLNAEHQAAVHALITQERAQKLELLIHLLANLQQPLVVCGPEGIGKTTLLSVLQERKANFWQYCLIKGSANLSFEAIQEELLGALSQDQKENQAQALPTLLARVESQKRKIVLIVDDAGALVPGLITSLIQYVAANSVLRLIFVLTHDELHIQSRYDHTIEDCHFIEIPTLSEKQCGEFLQFLAARPSVQLSYHAISDSMIESVYHKTHGIPGRIIAELPRIAVVKHNSNSSWWLPAAVLGLIAVALVLQWFSARQTRDDQVIKPAAVEQTAAIAIPPQVELPLAIDLGGQTQQTLTEIAQQSSGVSALNRIAKTEPELRESVANEQNSQQIQAGQIKPAVVEKETAKQANLNQANKKTEQPKPESTMTVNNPQQAVEEAVATIEKQASEGDGWQWLSTQPVNNYTLQLMVLSKQESITGVLNKYPAMAQGARTIKKVSNGKERYVLVYGSFASPSSALKAKASLPNEFSAAMVRKTGALKKELTPAGQP